MTKDKTKLEKIIICESVAILNTYIFSHKFENNDKI